MNPNNVLEISQWYYIDKSPMDEKFARLNSETVPFYLTKLEQRAKDNGGYLTSLKRTTWADVFTIAIIDYINSLLKRDILADYTNLTKVFNNVVNLDGIKKYLATRPADQIPQSLVAIY
jgi:Glutathione S-transferase, C-terminal domain